MLTSWLTSCGTTEGPVSPATPERVARAGEPISTDLSNLDPMMRSYLVRVRQTIEARLTHPPCEWQRRYVIWHCGYRTTHLVLEFIPNKRQKAKPVQPPLPGMPPPEPSGTARVLPMQLQVGDQITDEPGTWQVIARPYSSAGGKNTQVRACSGWTNPA